MHARALENAYAKWNTHLFHDTSFDIIIFEISDACIVIYIYITIGLKRKYWFGLIVTAD